MAEVPILWIGTEDGVDRLSAVPGDLARWRPATPGDLTAERVAAYLDRRAEAGNHYEFLGLHKYLAVLIADKAGVGGARAVMLELLRHGGLHGAG